jgi:hypothetical protein
MKNIKMSLKLFFIGYLIATIVGFTSYYINIDLMWVLIFTLMPVIFGYLFYNYLKRTKCEISETLKETNRLIILWIILSFLLDAVVYIIVIPIIYRHKSNWTFFIDQTPWIWLNYMTIMLLGHISRYIYIKKFKFRLPDGESQ